MRITIDLDSSQMVLGPGLTAPVTQLQFKRGSIAVLEIQFVRGIVVQELPGDASGSIEFKQAGRYDGDPLTGASSWIKQGTGTSTIYRFDIAFVTPALDQLFGVDTAKNFTGTADLLSCTAHGLIAGDTILLSSTGTLPSPLQPETNYYVLATGLTANAFKVSLTPGGAAVYLNDTGTGTHSFIRVDNDVPQVSLMADVAWKITGRDYKTQTITVFINNDVTRSGDTVPNPVVTPGGEAITQETFAALATAADGAPAVSTGLTHNPLTGYPPVLVQVNGLEELLGDGDKTHSCYFSRDAGATALPWNNIQAGDKLYWNGSIALYQLATTDLVLLSYLR